MKHIGIVAHSSEGAALCYRTICLEGYRRLGGWLHPEVTMSSIPMGRSMAAWETGDLASIAELLLEGAHKVAGAGAEFFVIPDNTAHLVLGHIRDRLPIPFLSIADVVCRAAMAKGMRAVGVLGTKYTMDGPVYREAFAGHGIEYVVPPPEVRAQMNAIIFDELVHGIFTRESLRYYLLAIGWLAEQGCDGVLLGCTEIPILMDGSPSPLPTLDSTRLLACGALELALAGE